jgi:GNAT superfamily N-acetyltransferase
LRHGATYEDDPLALPDDEFPRAYAQFLDRALSSARWRIWVAEEGPSISGTMAVEVVETVPRPARPDSRWGYLTSVYVHPESRGRGVGSMLLHDVQGWARREQLDLLLVWPSIESRAFFRRHGFEGVEPLTWTP